MPNLSQNPAEQESPILGLLHTNNLIGIDGLTLKQLATKLKVVDRQNRQLLTYSRSATRIKTTTICAHYIEQQGRDIEERCRKCKGTKTGCEDYKGIMFRTTQ